MTALANADGRCEQALSEIGRLLARLMGDDEIHVADVGDVYRIALRSGVYDSDGGAASSEVCAEVMRAGAEFLQLADAAERYQDSPVARGSWMDLIRDAAKSWMADRTIPEWSDRSGPYPHRP
jgi:hypothetical protein